MPTFKYFAGQMKDLQSKGLEIAIIEATKSDIDIKISGYPTIIFFDKMGYSVKFNSSRSFNSLREFMLLNSVIAKKYY